MASGEPFSPEQLNDIDKAIEAAHSQCGLEFATFVGRLPSGHATATELLMAMPNPENSVLIAVDPDARSVDVLTGPKARRWLGDDQCQLSILTMSSRFAVGDIPGGLHDGIIVMGEQAMHPTALFTDEPD